MKSESCIAFLALSVILAACGPMNDITVVNTVPDSRSGQKETIRPAEGTDAYSSYINRYSDVAREEMKEYGIPASITLAQGLLESDAGRSSLASKCNNHFGIKCHSDWKGGKTYRDDDLRNECFRCYRNADESFRDHSLFLRNGQRYAFLFDLEPDDYKGWAKGLKNAGYATSPVYATKLIELIDRYDLSRYDRPVRGTGGKYHAVGSASITRINGCLCVRVSAGMTLKDISRQFKVPVHRLRRINDMSRGMTVPEGTPIFVVRKKQRADRSAATHVVGPDESLWRISQMYGVRLESLIGRNGFDDGRRLAVGQVLRLR